VRNDFAVERIFISGPPQTREKERLQPSQDNERKRKQSQLYNKIMHLTQKSLLGNLAASGDLSMVRDLMRRCVSCPTVKTCSPTRIGLNTGGGLLRHFGYECTDTWKSEMKAAIVGGLSVALWPLFKTKGHASIHEAVVDGIGGAIIFFLLYATLNLVSTPWIERKGNGKNGKWFHSLVGVFIIILLLVAVGVAGFWLYTNATSPITLSTLIDPGSKDATIRQQSQTIAGLRKELNQRQSYKQMAARASELAKQIRDYQRSCYAAVQESFMGKWTSAARLEEPERSKIIREASENERLESARCEAHFERELLEPARSIANDMLARLSPEQVNKIKGDHGQADAIFNAHRGVGANAELTTAEYLDDLAKQVPFRRP
jgi:hypothetical protein